MTKKKMDYEIAKILKSAYEKNRFSKEDNDFFLVLEKGTYWNDYGTSYTMDIEVLEGKVQFILLDRGSPERNAVYLIIPLSQPIVIKHTHEDTDYYVFTKDGWVLVEA